MNFRQMLSPKPLTFVTSAVVGTASVTLSVVMFFSSQRTDLLEKEHNVKLQEVTQDYQQKYAKMAQDYESAVTQVNSRLATIERRLGTTSNSFDVRQLIVSPKDAANLLSRSQYFREGRFYGRKIAPGDKWTYETTTELKHVAEVSGMTADKFRAQLSPQEAKAYEQFPMHLWRGPQKYEIKGNYALKVLQPSVIVQKVPHSHMSQIFAHLPPSDAEKEADPATAEQIRKDNLASLNSMYRGDSTGILLSGQMTLELQLAASFRGAAHTNLKEIQKAGNVVYIQFETVLKGLEINHQTYDDFYVLREMLLISTPDELYLIKTLVPTTPDFGNEAIAWVNGWFADFGIPEQGTMMGSALSRGPGDSRTR